MALIVHDPLTSETIGGAVFPDAPPLVYPAGVRLGSAATPKWSPVPGVVGPIMNGVACAEYTPGDPFGPLYAIRAALYSDVPFPADQWAEMSAGIPAWDTEFTPPFGPPPVRSQGVMVRQDPASDSCYVAYAYYTGAELRDVAIVVDRINDGVVTNLAHFLRPWWCWRDDGWFTQIRVWGSDPVHLQIISKAPTTYQLTNLDKPSSGLPDFAELEYEVNGTKVVHASYEGFMDPPLPTSGAGLDDYWWFYRLYPVPYRSHGLVWPPAANEGAVPYMQAVAPFADARANPGRAWILWEGIDASADRLLTGQPGIRWGGIGSSFTICNFWAGSAPGHSFFIEPATVVDGAAVVAGSRLDGGVVAVECATGAVGPVSYPTIATWQATVSGLGPGAHTITASDGTTSAAIEVAEADTQAPVITAFAVPATHDALAIPITTLAADEAATFIVSENGTTPLGNDVRWGAVPATVAIGGDGLRTLYAWAKDTFGNVSARAQAQVAVTLPDTQAPVITGFVLPATSDSFTVPVTTLAANEAATWILSENGATPAAGDARWGAAPASVVVAGEGLRTVYAWAKDAAGNVSARAQASVTVTLPVEEPPPGPAPATVLKHASGTAATLKRWNGTQWVEVPMKTT
jgi:hypothetical protein